MKIWLLVVLISDEINLSFKIVPISNFCSHNKTFQILINTWVFALKGHSAGGLITRGKQYWYKTYSNAYFRYCATPG